MEENEGKIKCEACGEYYKRINQDHLTRCCRLTFVEYREKYYNEVVQENNEDPVKCMECGGYFKYINNNHLKNCCNMVISEYKEKYPNVQVRAKFSKAQRQRMSTAHIEKKT